MLIKNIWRFIWDDDSILSWIVNVVLAIVIVKFLIYPGLGLLLSTSFPVVAVVSCSMEHGLTNCADSGRIPDLCGLDIKGELNEFDNYWSLCGRWYESINITKSNFMSFPFENGFNKGDIMVLYGTDFEDIKTGDVIVFDSGLQGAPIIHRIVELKEDGVATKGDHNSDQNAFEKNIKNDRILGKAVFRIPYLGWVKVVFNDLIGG